MSAVGEAEKYLTQEMLKELLDYSKDNGLFTWKSSRRRGCVAGCNNGYRYIIIGINGKLYSAHRLAWLYIHGVWPKDQIDHINHDKTDNKISNLREATHRENGRNQKLRNTNTSGVTGVCWDKSKGKWRAQIGDRKTTVNLGYFADIQDAINTRKVAEKKYGYHANHGLPKERDNG